MVKAKKNGFYVAATSLGIFSTALLVAASAVWLYSPTFGTNAETITVRGTRSVSYNLALSTAATSEIAIVPTSTQTVFSGTDTLSIINSCAEGSTVTMSTNSTTDNDLTRIGTDSQTKTISATTGSNLVNNSWGYSLNNGTNYYPVPVSSSAATVYDSSAAANPDSVSIKFGIKTDNNLPSGSYSNDIVYTLAVKPACLTYTLNWDLDGGTGASGVSYTSSEQAYDSLINLLMYKPTRSGYLFGGWSDGTNTYTGEELAVNINAGDLPTVTLTAIWTETIQSVMYMQDLTPEICNAQTTPDVSATRFDWDGSHHGDDSYVPRAKMRDKRDNKDYLVSKLADGNCWMSQNLAFDLTANSPITNELTDLNTKTSWTPVHGTQTTAGTHWNASVDQVYPYDYSYHPEGLANSAALYYRGGKTAADTPTANTDAYLWESAGNYYNWNAATAGTGLVETMTDVEDSICPKGWQLPTGNANDTRSFKSLINLYNPTIDSALEAPLNFVRAGAYGGVTGTILDAGANGFYPTASSKYPCSSAGTQYCCTILLLVSYARIDPDEGQDRGTGESIRCVLRPAQ
jgi:uncharacterized repeat protein (TIGR02543 family)/uncharacterized protein (TIGR02145 family)